MDLVKRIIEIAERERRKRQCQRSLEQRPSPPAALGTDQEQHSTPKLRSRV